MPLMILEAQPMPEDGSFFTGVGTPHLRCHTGIDYRVASLPSYLLHAVSPVGVGWFRRGRPRPCIACGCESTPPVGVLASHPHRVLPLLWSARVVHHQRFNLRLVRF